MVLGEVLAGGGYFVSPTTVSQYHLENLAGGSVTVRIEGSASHFMSQQS